MIVYKDIEQGTTEWLQLRLATITGTRLGQVFKSNNLPLIDELISEELSNEIPEEGRASFAMQRGTDLEPVALDEYTQRTFIDVQNVGFVRNSDIEWMGFSPDGLVYEDEKVIGGVEIKCPSSKKHIEYIRTNKIPATYKYQVLSYFINCPDMKWLDFVSYDPRIERNPLHILRVTREEMQEQIDETIEGVLKFNEKRLKYYNQIVG